MKTFSLKESQLSCQYHIIDATGLVLGRLAAQIAVLLRGKHKPTFTPHMLCGDAVVVVNARDVFLSGDKKQKKKFYWHTGYPGGIKERTINQILNKHPERVLEKAVERMMSKGPLRAACMRRLKIYPGNTHPHSAQMPVTFDFGILNTKNKKTLTDN